MSAVMPALWVRADGELEVRRLPRPEADGDLVLARTLVSAVCGSDLHRFRGAASYPVDTDLFGHESVVEVVGQRLLHVPFPAEGRVFAPYQLARPGHLLPLPDGLEPEVAVLAQQLGTVLFALARFWPHEAPPRSAFVAGAGPAGLLFVQVLRRLGCADVVVSEPSANRRRLATSYGARSDADFSGADLVVDAVGEPEARQECLRRVRPGGVLGVFGLPDREPGELGISVLDLLDRGLTVVAAKGAQHEPGLASFATALRLLADGEIDVGALVTDRVRLDELPAACRRAAFATDEVVKVIAVFDNPSDNPEETM